MSENGNVADSGSFFKKKPAVPVTLEELSNPCEPLRIRDTRVLDDLLNQLSDHWIFGQEDKQQKINQEHESLLEAGDDYSMSIVDNHQDVEQKESDRQFVGMEIEGISFVAADPDYRAAASSTSSTSSALIQIIPHGSAGPKRIPRTMKEMQEHAWTMFGMTSDSEHNDLSHGKIDRCYNRNLYPVLRLWLEFVALDYVGDKTEATAENSKRISRILEVICTIKDILENGLRLMAAAYPQKGIVIPDEANMFKFSGIDFTKNTAYQNLLIELLKIIHRKGYKRYRGGIGEQERTDDHVLASERDGTGVATMSMRKVMSIKKFVYSCLKKETNYQLWSNATVSHSNIKMAIEHLTMCDEIEFPECEVDRHIFDFANGELDINEMTFLEWKDIAKRGHCRAASKFFNQYLDPKWMTDEYRENYDLIPTPLFETPFKHQQFTDGQMDMVYILGGRVLYWIDEHDGWGVIPFGRGVAGTGKSLWGRVTKSFYALEDIAVLSSNMERKFGLSQTKDKVLWLNYEMSANAEMDQMDFQSMVSGEEVCVNKKFEDPIPVEFKTPGMLFGNMMNRRWIDTSGQLKRRIFPFEYNFKVTPDQVDPKLYKKITTTEMAGLLVKYMWAYRNAALERSGDIWSWCPPEFHEAAARLHAQTNSITAFLETDIMERGDGKYVSFERFNALFMDFCKKRGLQRIVLTGESIGPVFEEYGFIVEKSIKYQEGKMMHGTWIMGVGVSEAHEDDARNKHWTPSATRNDRTDRMDRTDRSDDGSPQHNRHESNESHGPNEPKGPNGSNGPNGPNGRATQGTKRPGSSSTPSSAVKRRKVPLSPQQFATPEEVFSSSTMNARKRKATQDSSFEKIKKS